MAAAESSVQIRVNTFHLAEKQMIFSSSSQTVWTGIHLWFLNNDIKPFTSVDKYIWTSYCYTKKKGSIFIYVCIHSILFFVSLSCRDFSGCHKTHSDYIFSPFCPFLVPVIMSFSPGVWHVDSHGWHEMTVWWICPLKQAEQKPMESPWLSFLSYFLYFSP